MRWFGPLCGLNIKSKNGRGGTKHTQKQDLEHMLQNKEMFGGGSGKRLKRVLESILLLVKYSFSILYVNQLHWSKLYDPLKLDIYCTLPEEYVIRYKSMMLYILVPCIHGVI